MDNNYLALVYQTCEYLKKEQIYDLAEQLTKMSWKCNQSFDQLGLQREDVYTLCWQAIDSYHRKYGRLEFEKMIKIISTTFKRRIFDRIRSVKGRGEKPSTQVIYDNDLCLYNSRTTDIAISDISFKLFCENYISNLPSQSERKTITLFLDGYSKTKIAELLKLSNTIINKRYDNFVNSYKTMLN